MLLFIVAINPLIRELGEKYGEDNIAVFADDILIKGSLNFSEEDIKKIAGMAQCYGLEVNKEKCKRVDILSGNELLFAGIPLKAYGRIERVVEITDKYKNEL
jgi:hypothetical protein